MEFKGTKGKWTNHINDYGHITSVRSEDANRVIFTSRVNNMIESNANMVLATYSKEMFEILVNLNKYINEISNTNNLKFIADDLRVEEIQKLLTKITE
jgi:hypothetical protein